MGKRKGDQPNPQAQEPTVSEPAELASPSTPAEGASPEIAGIEAPAVIPLAVHEPQPEPEPVVAVAPAVIPEVAPIILATEPAKAEAVIADPVAPPPVDLRPAEAHCDEAIEPAAAPSLLSGWTTSLSFARARRLAPLAATIAFAAALGGMAGTFATAGLGGAEATAPSAQTADARVLKEQITRLHAEIAALKTSVDTSARTSSAQFIKVGDRLDRVEKGQAEPAAKLAKLADAVERIEHHTPTMSVAAAAHDITGSVGPVAALAPAPQLDGPPETRAPGPQVLEGWRVRSVFNGAALIQSRLGGVMEVEPGDNLPGLGRIQAIRRQDGKWVVITSKGMIAAR